MFIASGNQENKTFFIVVSACSIFVGNLVHCTVDEYYISQYKHDK